MPMLLPKQAYRQVDWHWLVEIEALDIVNAQFRQDVNLGFVLNPFNDYLHA